MNAIVESLNGCGARFAGFALPMLLQSALLIALLFALDLLIRKRVRATVRYAVWMLALVKLLLPPSLALPTGAAYWFSPLTKNSYSSLISGQPLISAPLHSQAIELSANPVPNLVPDTIPAPLTKQAVILVVWLAGVLGLAMWVIWQMRKVVGKIQQSTEGPETAQFVLDSCRQQLGIKTNIQIRCAAIGSPAICGVFRPVILIPPGLAENLDSVELRSVLLHELAHFQRGDLWINHAQIILQIFYWYNPLLWLANATIRRTREQATDEMVLVAMGGDAPSYSLALLHVAKLGLNRPFAALGLLGILEPGRGLTQRIKNIANRPLPRSARIGAQGATAVLLLALVALPMACRRQTEPTGQPLGSKSANANPANATVEGAASSDWSNKHLREPGIGVPKPLTPVEVDGLEAKLINDPEDFAARRDLILHYGFKDRAARAKHILWIIEHHPEFSVSPETRLDSILENSAYKKGSDLWLQNVKNHPTNTTILANASTYFTIYDNARAEDLLKKAQALEPSNPAWSEKLGDLYQLESMGRSGTASAVTALAEFEKARAQTSPAVPGSPILMKLAKMALATGDLAKAKRYADELLGPGMMWSGGGNSGDAFFYGNIVLGRIALREGRTEDAKNFLLEAGKTKGSAVLGSFGPNMALAKELLEKRETNAPLAYFEECRKFWTFTPNAEKLDKWSALVKEGKMPDFGGNLIY